MNRLGRVKTPTFLLGMGEGTIKRVHKATNEAGTMVRIGGSNLLMSPPLVLTEADVVKILENLRSGLSVL